MPTLVVHLTEPIPRADAEALVQDGRVPALIADLLLGWSRHVVQGGNSSRTKRMAAFCRRAAAEQRLPIEAVVVDKVDAYLQAHGLIPTCYRSGKNQWCLTDIEDWGGQPAHEDPPENAALPYDLVVRNDRGAVVARGKAADRHGGKAALAACADTRIGATHVDLVLQGRVVETFSK